MNQRIRVDFGNGRVEEYPIPDGEDYHDDLKDWIEQIYTEESQWTAKVTYYYETRNVITLYDGPTAKCWAENTE